MTAPAWSDEFDGPAGAPVDPSTWRFEVGGHGWGNDELQHYTDGQPYHAVAPDDLPGPWVFEHDFYLLLNVAVGGTSSVPPDDDALPRTMLVDHIRVYATEP